MTLERECFVAALALALLGCGEPGGGVDGGSTGGTADAGTEGSGEASTAGTTVDPSAGTGSGGPTTGDPETTGDAIGPTFAEDVAPIFERHCWSCHVDGGVAPFSLIDYETAAQLAPVIVPVTQSRTMPPWPVDASGDCGSFVDERWLSDDELATIAAWAEVGAPAGDLSLAPDPPSAPPSLESVSASVAVQPYTPQGNPPEQPFDDYRCFVVDPGTTADTVLTAFEVHPGVAEQAHHMVLFALGSDAAQTQALAQSGADGRPGYTCFGGANVPEATIVGAWAPGVPVVRYPEGTGAPVPGGRALVLQMHYNLAAGELEDTTSVDLQFDPTATPLRQVILVDTNLAIPPDTVGHEETITQALDGNDLTLITAFPHMHQIGTRIRVDLADGSCGIDVPRYDFNWQQTYSYVEPLVVPGGSEVTLTCTFDSTGRDEFTTFGEGTSDEMCAVQFFALP